MEDERTVRFIIPALSRRASRAEQSKGSPLDRAEVLEIRDNGAVDR